MNMCIMLLWACGAKDQSYSFDPKEETMEVTMQEPSTNGIESEAEMHYQSATYCAECHPTHYEQWRQSMHSYAMRSPVFQAMNAKAYRDSGGEIEDFCTRCHSLPASEIGEFALETYEQRSSISQEGVTCITCHQSPSYVYPIGNANLQLDPQHAILGPFDDIDQSYHASQKGTLLTSSELCGSCHDVFMYPGIEIEQAFSEYQSSPAYQENLRCQDCHMSTNPGAVAEKEVGPIAVVDGVPYPNRKLSSHYFTGPDYSLVTDWPTADETENLRLQEESVQRTQKLLENSVEIFSAEGRRNGPNLDIRVELFNKSKGHRVPTGFTSERQMWLHIQVQDAQGDIIFETGDLDSYNDLRNHHSWDVLSEQAELDTQLVNFQSENLVVHRSYREDGENNGMVTTTFDDAVFPFQATSILRHSLQPNSKEDFSFQTPIGGASLPIKVQIDLKYRNLPPYIFREMQITELSEKLQIFTIDSRVLSVP